jgi:hypothetical protein
MGSQSFLPEVILMLILTSFLMVYAKVLLDKESCPKSVKSSPKNFMMYQQIQLSEIKTY